jgi:hypothetical protein
MASIFYNLDSEHYTFVLNVFFGVYYLMLLRATY